MQVRWSTVSASARPPPTCVLVHGILGSRRNMATFAQRLVQVRHRLCCTVPGNIQVSSAVLIQYPQIIVLVTCGMAVTTSFLGGALMLSACGAIVLQWSSV